MNMIALVLAIVAALAFLAAILQGIVAAKELITHSVRVGQQKKWLGIISICIVLTVIFGYASYSISLPKSGPPSPTQSATPTEGTSLPPTPTASPTTPVSSILYRSDWSTGKAGWSAPSTRQSDAAWSVDNGELISNGQTVYDPTASGFSTIQAPYHPEDHGIQDYAVETEILVNSKIPNKAENSFGIGVRRYFDASQNQDQGYGCRVVANTQNNNYIAIYLQPATIPPGGSTTFNPGNGWHTYRIEVRGSDITVFVDKKFFLHVTDGSFTHGGKVEIWEEFDQVTVRSFIIFQL